MTKQETYDYLTAHGVAYEAMEHGAVFNMAEAAQLALPHPEAEAKNLFVRDDKKQAYYLLCVRGDKRVDLKAFRRQHGLRPLNFASPEDLARLLALSPGSVTPLGLLNDQNRQVKLYLDRDFLQPPALIGAHPNDNTATVWIQTEDLIALIRAHGNDVELTEIA